MKDLEKFYIPVYILDKETEHEPWHQLFVTRDCFGHIKADWVINQDGEVVCGDNLSSFWDGWYDGYCVTTPLVLNTFTGNPDELLGLLENFDFIKNICYNFYRK